MSESTQMAKEDVTRTYNTRLPLEVTGELFSDRRRRLAFAVVQKRSGPISASALATEVAIRERDKLQDAVPHRIHRRVLLSLVHCHLPKLDEAGVVEYDAEERRVDGTGRVTGPSPSDAESRETGTESREMLTHERQRVVLSVLDDSPDSTYTLSELADRVAERKRDADIGRIDAEVRTRIEVSLHHRHLPKLADADLLAYDAEDGTVELAE